MTVVVPGGSGAAREVLAQGEPEPHPERDRAPRRRRGLLLLLAVLALGAASAVVDQRERPEPAREGEAPDPFAGVQASSQLLAQDELRVRLLVEVRVAGAAPAAGLAGTRPASAQVLLDGLSSPGLVVRLPGRPLPVPLGYLGRTGTGLEQVVRLTVDAVALGCVEPQRAPRLALDVSRGPVGSSTRTALPVRDRAEVTEALEALVRRSCGRLGS